MLWLVEQLILSASLPPQSGWEPAGRGAGGCWTWLCLGREHEGALALSGMESGAERQSDRCAELTAGLPHLENTGSLAAHARPLGRTGFYP